MDKIELISIKELDNNDLIESHLRSLSRSLNIEFGWHYMLDFIWVSRHLNILPKSVVLDAGAGNGLFQWWLANKGIVVISVDRLRRYSLPAHFINSYIITGFRWADFSKIQTIKSLYYHAIRNIKTCYFRNYGFHINCRSTNGKIIIYNQDLTSLTHIPDNSVDNIVSISSLEHNSLESIDLCINELIRVLKPGGKIVATLSASNKEDWFHFPSNGWCITEETLRNIFKLHVDCVSNFTQYDNLFEELTNCDYLKKNLSNFYFKSNNNGMPWGIWDPKYQPVGIVKTKNL